MWNKNERYLLTKLFKANLRDFSFNLRQVLFPLRLDNAGAIEKLPPARLRIRVGEPRRERYLGNGKKLCDLLLSHINNRRPIGDFNKILDWGCGCGRVSRHLLCHIPAEKFHGCDIDAEAISWMDKNFHQSSFTVVNPYPPTPFQDNFFDLIYGISVFTHLDEELQFRWLKELKRICSPDGIVAVSVHGGTPKKRPEMEAMLRDKGFADMKGNKTFLFNQLEDKDYYRETKHSKEYIFREWARYFQVIEFIDRGLGRQDLVILEKLPGSMDIRG